MARPVSRRRTEREAPDGDTYAAGRGRVAKDEPEEERRPRRGRGELPAARRDEEPTSRRRAAREPEPPDEPTLPTTPDDLDALTDEEYEALCERFDVPKMDDLNEESDALLAAILDHLGPEPEEPPRSRRGRRSEPEPEEEPPSRGRGRGRAAAADDEDKSRGRGRRSGGGDDDSSSSSRTPRRGFAGFKKTREETTSFDDFKLTDEEVLVKFLEDEPFAAYAEHGLYQELREGQRVWICLRPEEECAICDTGHDPRAVGLFNIVVMPEDGNPALKVLKAGPALAKILETKAKLKTGPLSKEYYSLSQSPGKNDGPVVYSVEVVRERDLEEDWKEKPFSDDELAEFRDKMNDETFVKYPSKSDVKDVAKRLRDRD